MVGGAKTGVMSHTEFKEPRIAGVITSPFAVNMHTRNGKNSKI